MSAKEIERILATSGKYITYAERCYVLDYITNLKDTLKDREEYCYGLETQLTNLQQKLEYYENIDPDKTIDKFRQKINKEITNLQEENKELKHKLEQMYNDTKDTYNEICAEQIDYKSRNEKAIKYNYELQERYCHSALFDDLVASKIYEITEKQLNILQGENDDRRNME